MKKFMWAIVALFIGITSGGCAGNSYLKNSRTLAVVERQGETLVKEVTDDDALLLEGVIAQQVLSDDGEHLYGLVGIVGVEPTDKDDIKKGPFLTGYQAKNTAAHAAARGVTVDSPAGGNRKRFHISAFSYDDAENTLWFLLPSSIILVDDLGLVQIIREDKRPKWHYLGPGLVLGPPITWATLGRSFPPNWKGVAPWENEEGRGPSIMAIGMYPEGALRKWHINSGHAEGAPEQPETNARLSLSQFNEKFGLVAPKKKPAESATTTAVTSATK